MQLQRQQTAVRAVTVMLIAMATWNGTGRAMGDGVRNGMGTWNRGLGV